MSHDFFELAKILIGAIASVLLARIAAENRSASVAAAKQVEGVRTTLAATAKEGARRIETLATEETLRGVGETMAAEGRKIDNLAIVSKATHTLVNSGHGAALREIAALKRERADWNPTPQNIRLAEAAERASAEHDARQAEVDAQPGTADEKAGR